ncbi:transglutaminase superfamily protein [Chitinophaga dinghuensis]|uniref:Transglutaminase superfamily protein n=1 Tax=Chitinophaga dinghuensis TaxID=1539050 RepID=A0A327VRJ8_9BACT|nr:lasso peptide biosynthesis B2 protein [Chitinophaga dinghuensis]RAJ76670.1 transglutaminase superfamily protein [Chitinophaga dinghuensis]
MYYDHDLISLNRALRANDRMFFRARMLTILIETSLRFTSLKTTEKILSILAKKVSPPNEKEMVAILDKYATIFNQINHQPDLKGRCLSQSLALRCLLQRKGITSALKIGVNQIRGNFDAHAWLERDGILINDHPSVIANYFVLPESKLNMTLKIK